LRTFWRILFTAVLFAGLGGGAVLAVAYRYTQRLWPPDQLTAVAAIGVAVLAAYAGGITALMAASVRALLGAAKLVEREAAAPLRALGEELEGR